MKIIKSPVTRILNLVKEEKSDITAIYFFAMLGGLIQLSVPIGIQAIIGFVVGGSISTSLIILIILLIVAVLFVGITQINQMKIIERIQQRIFVKYTHAFAESIPKINLIDADEYYLPELMNRFFDIGSLQKSISKLLLDIPTAIIQILFGLILLSFYHPFFILFSILLIVILWTILYNTGGKGLEYSLEESNHKYAVAGWFQEMGRLIKTFKFSTPGGLHLLKANEKTIHYLNARTKHFGVLLIQYKTLTIFKVAITAAMLITGVILLLDQQINIGQFVASEIIILSVLASVEKIIINLDSVYDVLTAIEKIEKITDKPMEVGGTYQLTSSAPLKVEATNIGFNYTHDKQIINNLSFTIAPGNTACIIGKDGAGKSTLLKILTGVYTDINGSIMINDVPMGNYNLNNLRDKIGFYFPAENIFQGSLWENITMGRINIDKDYINYLSDKVGLKNYLATLPKGYDTHLDPTGKKLPRNVIQKIILIRALAHQPKLLILEEPWQGMEEHFIKDIQQLLLGLKNTTVIVATNDEYFIKQCNQIIEIMGDKIK